MARRTEPRQSLANSPRTCVYAFCVNQIEGSLRLLERASRAARGTYVAVIDSDDRAHPERLSRQVAFLRANEDHVIVGSAMRLINDLGEPIGLRRYPTQNKDIERTTMLFNPFGHSTICFRRREAIACGGYTEEFAGAEDFDFNVRLRTLGKGANLPEALVDYRIHDRAFKAEKLRLQLSDTIRLRSACRRRFGYRLTLRAAFVDLAERIMLLLPPAFVGWLFASLLREG